MNICEEYAALLDLYVDGELAAEDMARVQTHLDRCPACRAYVDDVLAIRAAFPNVEDTVLPQGFHASVMAAVAADAARETAKAADAKAIDAKSETSKTADHKAPCAKQRRRGAWASMLPLAAACLAVVVLVEGGVLNSASGKSAAPAAGYAQSVERAAMAPAAAPESEAAADVQSEEPREVTDMAASPAPPAAPMAHAPAAMDVSDPADAKTSGESADNQPSVFTAAAQALEAALGDYFAVVHLTGDAARADALAGLEPVALADGRRGYELDRTQYEALLRELGGKGAQPETEEFDTASETALAVVEE